QMRTRIWVICILSGLVFAVGLYFLQSSKNAKYAITFSPWMKRSFLLMLLLILIISKTIYLIGQHYRLQKNQSIYDKMSAYYMKMDFLKVSKVNGNRINKSLI